jgi:hypothetical protein
LLCLGGMINTLFRASRSHSVRCHIGSVSMRQEEESSWDSVLKETRAKYRKKRGDGDVSEVFC